MSSDCFLNYMNNAYMHAQVAFNQDEIPVGALIVQNDKIIMSQCNNMQRSQNPLQHAEILAINSALLLLDERYFTGCDMWVTLEPCAMCAHAICLSRIRRLYFGAYSSHQNTTQNIYNKFNIEVYGGIMENKCKSIIQKFLQSKRYNKMR